MSNRTDTYYNAESAVHGYGAQIEVGNGASPEVFEAIAGVTSIKPGEVTTDDIDRTHLRSPDAHKEHSAGMRDSGPIEFDGIYLPGEQSLTNDGGGSGAFMSGGLPYLHAQRSTHNFRIKLADNTAVIVRGYVSKFSLGEINSDGNVPYNAAVQPTEAYDHP
jgi:hypothetical protein